MNLKIECVPMRHVASMVLLLAALAPCAARIGETEAELAKRLGSPHTRTTHKVAAQGKLFELGPSLSFKQGDWRIQCDLVDDRCVRISYTKIGQWSDEQLQTVLNANSQGATWTEVGRPSARKSSREWRRSDGAVATWVSTVGIKIRVPAYDRAKTVAEAKAAASARQTPKI
jgi:hypothetical protein